MYEFEEKVLKIAHGGREIYGILTSPKGKEKYPIVIFSHGYNGIGDDFKTTADFLAGYGVGAYCFDFCGGSSRSRSTMKTVDMTIFTEKEDLVSIVEYFENYKEVEKIFLFGGSQGGLVSALTADELKEKLAGLILLYPAFCIADDWDKRFPNEADIPAETDFWGMKLGGGFFKTLRGYKLFDHVGEFDKDVLVIHGSEDPIVPMDYIMKLKDIYKDVEIEIFENEGHGFSEEGTRRTAELVLDYVLSH